jgi:subtilisin family serine protease
VVLGGITSPGNSPFAITVGALNTNGTAGRADDTVADYSSRGPTKYENIVKPDLAAPGTRVVSLEAAGSYLPTQYPYLHRAGTSSNAYMYLSGTSMATPIVSGAAALLLQGTPSLGTAHVKLALQSGAAYMRDGGLLGGGAGSLNIWASRKFAAGGLSLSSLTSTLLGGVLATPSGASFWDAGTLGDRVYKGLGIRLLSLLDLSRIWSNPSHLKYGDLNLAGLLNPLASMHRNRLLWGDTVMTYVANDDDQIIWGTSMSDGNGDQIIWGTSGDDQIIWGTGVMTDENAR